MDTRPSWLAAGLIAPSAAVLAAWRYAEHNDDKEKIKFLEDNFALNLKNIDEGRYHTFITNMFGCGNNFLSFAVTQALPVLLYGGNIGRNVGAGKTIALYLLGQTIFNTAGFALNFYQRELVRNLYPEANRATDLFGGTGGPGSIKSEKRKFVFATERQQEGLVTPDAMELRLRQILRMGDTEFLQLADQRYSSRIVPGVGGGLMLAAVALRMHPLGLLPLPFLPFPVLGLAPLAFVSMWSAHRDYVFEEMLAALGPSFFVGVLLGGIIAKSGVPVREMPVKIMQRLKMSKWTLEARSPPAPAPSPIIPKQIQTPQGPLPNAQQLEQMRRRNSKFQRKNQQQSQGTTPQNNTKQ
jgi:hypothetical protein